MLFALVVGCMAPEDVIQPEDLESVLWVGEFHWEGVDEPPGEVEVELTEAEDGGWFGTWSYFGPFGYTIYDVEATLDAGMLLLRQVRLSDLDLQPGRVPCLGSYDLALDGARQELSAGYDLAPGTTCSRRTGVVSLTPAPEEDAEEEADDPAQLPREEPGD
jgi:hypothetical protein